MIDPAPDANSGPLFQPAADAGAGKDDAKPVELRSDALGEPTDYKEMRRRAFAWAKDNLKERRVSNPDPDHGGDWLVTMHGVKHTLREGRNPDVAVSVTALPELIERAHYVGNAPDETGRPFIKQIEYWDSPLRIDGRDYTVRLTAVRVAADSKQFAGLDLYYHHALNKEAARASSGTLAGQSPVGSINAQATSNIPAPPAEGKPDNPDIRFQGPEEKGETP